MFTHLMIESFGEAPVEAYTLMGASAKAANAIGKFGTGGKYGLALLMRKRLSPTIYCGRTKLEFSTDEVEMSGKVFHRVMYSENGRRPKDTGFVTALGRNDWTSVGNSCREYVANALDMGIQGTVVKLTTGTSSKEGKTRVFIPLDDDGEVKKFRDEIDLRFLHFANSPYLQKELVPKLSEQQPRIYHRGVYVRSIATQLPSLFDYNLENLIIDESRNLNDYSAMYSAGVALGRADGENRKLFLKSLNSGIKYWEHTLPEGYYSHSGDWSQTFEEIYGKTTIVANQTSAATAAKRKGYNVIYTSEALCSALRLMKIRTPVEVLDYSQLNGREECEAPAYLYETMHCVWKHMHGTSGKSLPELKCFTSVLDAEAKTLGYYKDGTVYICTDLVSETPSTELLTTMLEELVHYVTGSTDNSRDFQDYCLNFGVRMMKGEMACH